MQLKSADLFYGTLRYPINVPLPQEVPFAPLSNKLLDEVASAVALASGCSSRENVIARVTHNRAIPEQIVPLPSGEIVIPASVSLIGNGFSVI